MKSPLDGKRLRIAFFIDTLANLGGYQVFTNNLMLRLQARGHDVTAFVYASKLRRDWSFHARAPFPVKPVSLCSTPIIKHLSTLPATMLRLAQARHAFDVWQIIGVYPEAYLARGLVGQVPVAVRCYGQDIQTDRSLGYGSRLNPMVDRRIRRELPRLDRFVAMGSSLAEEYRNLGIPEDKIRIIPNGVELSQQATTSQDLESLRLELGISHGSFILLTVGRNHPKKNFTILPRVAALLEQEGLDFTWIMVGPKTESLLPQVRQFKLESRFRLLGALFPDHDNKTKLNGVFHNAKLEMIYRLADAFVFPAKIEGFNRTLVEAMAASIPLITTTAPGCRDIVTDGFNGFTCDPDDQACFADKILCLSRDKLTYDLFVRNCQAEVPRYDWEAVTDQYEQMYQELCDHT